MRQPEKGVRPQRFSVILTIRHGRGRCNGKSAGNEGRLVRRVGAPGLQPRHLVPESPGNAPHVAAGPVNPVAAGTLKETAVVQEDVL